MRIASYHFANRSPIDRMYFFQLDSGKGPIMSKATCQKGARWFLSCQVVYVSGVATLFDGISRKLVQFPEHPFSSWDRGIVLEPDQMS